MRLNLSIFLSRQYAVFLVVGGVAALLHWASRIALSFWLPFEVAVFLSYFIGLVTAFLLNRQYVFPRTNLALRVQVQRFILVNLIAMPIVWITAVALYDVFWWVTDNWVREAVSHGLAVTVPAITSFIAYKFFAFTDYQAD